MAENDLPWFSFYVRDWMDSDDVGVMSDSAIVCYLHLLCRQWIKGSIPDDPKKLALLLRRPVDHFVTEIWPQVAPCFIPAPDAHGRLVNPRLLAERGAADRKVEENSANASKGGSASAKRRAAATRPTAVEAPVEPRLNRGSSTGSTDVQQHGHAHGHEHADLAAGASLSSSSSAGAGALAGREREHPRIEDALPDGNATASERKPNSIERAAAVRAVEEAWTATYRAATGQSPHFGPRQLAKAQEIADRGLPAAELRARLARFRAGAPEGFWRNLRPGEFPDIGGFEHCIDRLVDAPLPAATGPPVRAEPAAARIHPRLAAEFARYQTADPPAPDAPRAVEARAVVPRAGLPPPIPLLAAAGGDP